MILSRRAFFRGAGALALSAPAIVRVANLMALKFVPPYIWGDSIHDDTEAINALFRDEIVEHAPHFTAAATEDAIMLTDGSFCVSGGGIIVSGSKRILIARNRLLINGERGVTVVNSHGAVIENTALINKRPFA